MAKVGLSLAQIYALTKPQRGPSGAINPDADTPFRKLAREISTGYHIQGLEPQNVDGSFVLIPGTWKNRGG